MAWWALAITAQPDYVSGVLGGMTLTGIGVGLTLPTMMATASGSLPPPSFATGSAVINMIRQTGLALGVAILVAVLGTTATHVPELTSFRHAWWVTAAISFAAVSLLSLCLNDPQRPRKPPESRRAHLPAVGGAAWSSPLLALWVLLSRTTGPLYQALATLAEGHFLPLIEEAAGKVASPPSPTGGPARGLPHS